MAAITASNIVRNIGSTRISSVHAIKISSRPSIVRASGRGRGMDRLFCKAKVQEAEHSVTAPSPKLEVDSTGLDPMAEMLLSSTEKLAWNGLGIGLAFVVMMGLYADPVQAHDAIADPSQMAPNELWSMAEGEDFWSNMGRYAKYAVTVVFGTGYVIVKPLFSLLKKPQTAIPFILAVVGLVAVIRWTLITMLGLNDPETLN